MLFSTSPKVCWGSFMCLNGFLFPPLCLSPFMSVSLTFSFSGLLIIVALQLRFMSSSFRVHYESSLYNVFCQKFSGVIIKMIWASLNITISVEQFWFNENIRVLKQQGDCWKYLLKYNIYLVNFVIVNICAFFLKSVASFTFSYWC